MSRDEGYAQIRLPSGEIRNQRELLRHHRPGGQHRARNVVLGKAGRSRHRGIRPINRGVAATRWTTRTVAAQGKSKSGGGWQQLTSPWGLLAKGYRTRPRRNTPTGSSWFAVTAGR
jgi:large subunit ribosomal protein L2